MADPLGLFAPLFNQTNQSNVSKVQPAPSSLFGSIVDKFYNRTKTPPGYVAPSPNAILPALPTTLPTEPIPAIGTPNTDNYLQGAGGVGYDSIDELLRNILNISYPTSYNSAITGQAGTDILSQILGLTSADPNATQQTQSLTGMQQGITDLIQQLSSQAAGGGLTPEYVQAQKQMVYDPMMETLIGNLNKMGGGVTNLGMGDSAELQRRATNDFMANLTNQGFQNQNQLSQTAITGLDALLGNLQQFISGQQQYGLNQSDQMNELIKDLLAKYGIEHPNVQGNGSNWGATIANLAPDIIDIFEDWGSG